MDSLAVIVPVSSGTPVFIHWRTECNSNLIVAIWEDLTNFPQGKSINTWDFIFRRQF